MTYEHMQNSLINTAEKVLFNRIYCIKIPNLLPHHDLLTDRRPTTIPKMPTNPTVAKCIAISVLSFVRLKTSFPSTLARAEAVLLGSIILRMMKKLEKISQ
jgi:hypothetical protein